MADERGRGRGGAGPFYICGSFDEVGPDLGRLYAARHALSGTPLLLFMPGDGVEWQSEGPWQMRIRYESHPPSLRLYVDQAPESVRFTQLMDTLVLMTAAGQRVEGNPRVDAHLAHRSLSRLFCSRSALAVAGGVLFLLGAGTSLACRSWNAGQAIPGMTAGDDLPQRESRFLSQPAEMETAPIAYPMPDKPLENQAVAPCHPEMGEEEINSGCWIELARRAPCIEVAQAEHQGKCYAPVSKERRKARKPLQSAQP